MSLPIAGRRLTRPLFSLIFLMSMLQGALSLGADVSPAPLLELKGHKDGIASLAFSRDGRMLVSGGFDRSMRLWDTTSGKELKAFPDFDHFVVATAFSPDGERLLSVERDNTLRLREAATGKELWKAKDNSGEMILSASFSPDGSIIASANSGGEVRLWDAPTGKPAWTFKGKGDLVIPLLFSDDGRHLLVGSDKNTQILDIISGKPVKEYKNPSQRSPRTVSPDGKYMLYRSGTKEKLLLRIETGETVLKITGDFRTFVFSPDARYLVSGNSDGVLSIGEVSKGAAFISAPSHAGSVTAAAFSQDGKYLASGGLDNIIKIWDFSSFGAVTISAPVGFGVDNPQIDSRKPR